MGGKGFRGLERWDCGKGPPELVRWQKARYPSPQALYQGKGIPLSNPELPTTASLGPLISAASSLSMCRQEDVKLQNRRPSSA